MLTISSTSKPLLLQNAACPISFRTAVTNRSMLSGEAVAEGGGVAFGGMGLHHVLIPNPTKSIKSQRGDTHPDNGNIE